MFTRESSSSRFVHCCESIDGGKRNLSTLRGSLRLPLDAIVAVGWKCKLTRHIVQSSFLEQNKNYWNQWPDKHRVKYNPPPPLEFGDFLIHVKNSEFGLDPSTLPPLPFFSSTRSSIYPLGNSLRPYVRQKFALAISISLTLASLG